MSHTSGGRHADGHGFDGSSGPSGAPRNDQPHGAAPQPSSASWPQHPAPPYQPGPTQPAPQQRSGPSRAKAIAFILVGALVLSIISGVVVYVIGSGLPDTPTAATTDPAQLVEPTRTGAQPTGGSDPTGQRPTTTATPLPTGTRSGTAPMPTPTGPGEVHPIGPKSSFLSSAYASGVTTRKVSGILQGTAQDASVYAIVGDGSSLVGYNTVSGAEVWRIDRASCLSNSYDGTLLCIVGDQQVALIDVKTGKQTPVMSAQDLMYTPALIGLRGNEVLLSYRSAVDTTFVSMTNTNGTLTQKWATTIPGSDPLLCSLAGDHIACIDNNVGYLVLAAEDGKVEINPTPEERSALIRWYTDGFLVPDTNLTTMKMYNYANQQVNQGDTPTDDIPPVNDKTVHYALADVLHEDVKLADADGNVVVRDTGTGATFASGAMIDDFRTWIGTSADGSVSAGTSLDALFLYDKNGTVIDQLDGVDPALMNGLLFDFDDDGDLLMLVPKQ